MFEGLGNFEEIVRRFLNSDSGLNRNSTSPKASSSQELPADFDGWTKNQLVGYITASIQKSALLPGDRLPNAFVFGGFNPACSSIRKRLGSEDSPSPQSRLAIFDKTSENIRVLKPSDNPLKDQVSFMRIQPTVSDGSQHGRLLQPSDVTSMLEDRDCLFTVVVAKDVTIIAMRTAETKDYSLELTSELQKLLTDNPHLTAPQLSVKLCQASGLALYLLKNANNPHVIAKRTAVKG
jgi:hypothetical protein